MFPKILNIIFILIIQYSFIISSENIAYKRTVTATSIESNQYKAEYAVDANGNTRWSSQYYDNQNFIVDLWKVYTIGSVVINWEAAYASQFQVQVSTDNRSWKTVYENYAAKGGKMIIVHGKLFMKTTRLKVVKWRLIFHLFKLSMSKYI